MFRIRKRRLFVVFEEFVGGALPLVVLVEVPLGQRFLRRLAEGLLLLAVGRPRALDLVAPRQHLALVEF